MNEVIMSEEILKQLSAVITEKSGLYVGPDHIHESNRRHYYIPKFNKGDAFFGHHYRGPFFVDIPKEDWIKLAKGEITPEEYVDSTRWFFGYYWGGGSMVGGGYFTPLECTAGIHDKEKIRRIMKPFSCRGCYLASGYRPSESECMLCDVTYCPYSAVAEKTVGETSELANLPDNRYDFFKAVNDFIEKEYGYKLHGMCCGDAIPVDHIRLYPNYGERTFELYISDEYVKELLCNPKVAGFNWDREVEAMKIFVCKPHVGERKLIESPEDFESALHEFGIIAEWEEYEEKRRQWEEERRRREEERRNAEENPSIEIDTDESLWTRFCNWLFGIFKK